MLRHLALPRGTAALSRRAAASCLAIRVAARGCATNANRSAGTSSNYGNNDSRRGGRSGAGPRVLPPAFDIVHWNDSDVAAGHLLRVIHQDSFIVLDYHRQTAKVNAAAEEAEDGSSGSAASQQRPRRSHLERVVTVTLPPVYIARFLGVLEGRAGAVEVQSRLTDATFTKAAGVPEAEKSFVLSCTSRRPTTGQRQTADGQDVAEETVSWTVPMNPAESLMLHRFLTQALQYNTGFSRNL